MLYCVCGSDFDYNMGNLKTYFMTELLIIDAMKGRDLFANYKLIDVPYQPIQNIQQLISAMADGKRGLSIGLDELHAFFDAYDRPSKKDGTKDLKTMIRETRKRSVNLYYTAQSFFDIHLSVRRVTHKVYVTKKYDHVIDPSGDVLLIPCEDDQCKGKFGHGHIIGVTPHRVVGGDLIPLNVEADGTPVTTYMHVIPEIFNRYDSEELVGLY